MFIFTPELIIFMLKLDKKEYGVLRTTNFNPAGYTIQWIQFIFSEVFFYICIYCSAPTVAVYCMKSGGGWGNTTESTGT